VEAPEYILKLDESCTSNPKAEISDRTSLDRRFNLKFRLLDLRCRIRPISKFFWSVLAAFYAFALLSPEALHAHDIPADIGIHAFLKPEGQRLRFLVRVPLKAMRDIEFPKRGPGYLDLDRVDEYLRDGSF